MEHCFRFQPTNARNDVIADIPVVLLVGPSTEEAGSWDILGLIVNLVPVEIENPFATLVIDYADETGELATIETNWHASTRKAVEA